MLLVDDFRQGETVVSLDVSRTISAVALPAFDVFPLMTL